MLAPFTQSYTPGSRYATISTTHCAQPHLIYRVFTEFSRAPATTYRTDLWVLSGAEGFNEVVMELAHTLVLFFCDFTHLRNDKSN